MSNFFNLLKLEFIKIFRDKFVMFLLIIFPLLVIMVCDGTPFVRLGGVSSFEKSYNVAIFDTTTTEESKNKINGVMSITKDNKCSKTYYNDEEKFFQSIKTDEYDYYFYFKDDDGFKGIMYLNGGSLTYYQNIATTYYMISDYNYTALKSFFAEYGVEIQDSAYAGISVQTYNAFNGNYVERFLPMASVSIIFVLVMFSICFTIAKEKEAGTIKQIIVSPVKINNYILTKIIPYWCLALLQAVLIFLLLNFGYYLNILPSILPSVLVCVVMAIATSFIAMIISLLIKTSKTSIVVSLIFFIIPMFIVMVFGIDKFGLIIKLLCYLSPLTPSLMIVDKIVFNGMFDYINFAILILQLLVFYITMIIVTKKQTNR